MGIIYSKCYNGVIMVGGFAAVVVSQPECLRVVAARADRARLPVTKHERRLGVRPSAADSDGGGLGRAARPGSRVSLAPQDKMVEAAEGNIVKLRITSDIDEIDEHKGTFVAEEWITFECKVLEYPDGPISRDHKDILNGSIIPFMPTSLFSNSLEHLESDSTYEVKDKIIRGYIGYKSTFPLFFVYSSMPFDKKLLMIKLIQNPAFVRSWGEVVFEHLIVLNNIA